MLSRDDTVDDTLATSDIDRHLGQPLGFGQYAGGFGAVDRLFRPEPCVGAMGGIFAVARQALGVGGRGLSRKITVCLLKAWLRGRPRAVLSLSELYSSQVFLPSSSSASTSRVASTSDSPSAAAHSAHNTWRALCNIRLLLSLSGLCQLWAVKSRTTSHLAWNELSFKRSTNASWRCLWSTAKGVGRLLNRPRYRARSLLAVNLRSPLGSPSTGTHTMPVAIANW